MGQWTILQPQRRKDLVSFAHGHPGFGRRLERRERAPARGGVVLKKSARLNSSEEISCADKARLILGLRRHHKLADLLQAAGLARSTFFYQSNAIQRSEPSSLEVKIRAVYDENKGRYGYRRITAALCSSSGEFVNHKCVQRLMQKMGLRALIRAKRSNRYVPAVSDLHVPNALKRDFFAKALNEKWATDITEFNVNGKKLYLSACMDLYNGEIIAHCLARRPVFDLVASTLNVALSRSKDTTGLTVYSDQGWHYKVPPYRAMLTHRGVTQSMCRKGNCFVKHFSLIRSGSRTFSGSQKSSSDLLPKSRTCHFPKKSTHQENDGHANQANTAKSKSLDFSGRPRPAYRSKRSNVNMF